MQSLSEISVQFVKGVGPAKKKVFDRLGVETVEDLMYFFPRRYEDRRNLTPIAQLQVGEFQTITGKIINQSARKSWYTKKHVTEIIIDDGGGKIYCVWFNQPYLNNYLKDGKKIVCYGKVDIYKKRLQMVSPEYEVIDDEEDALSLKRIVPIYPLTRGITQRFLRRTIQKCLDVYQDRLEDHLPVVLRNEHRLSNIKRSIGNIHFPEDFKDQEAALKRISFEEFYFFQVSVILRRLSITHKPGKVHKISDSLVLGFMGGFPFEFTKAQKNVIKEIREDMQKREPMLRLLQGDVGSGKTLVAVFGCYAAFKNGLQSAFMAPTEILARQHYENITRIFEGLKDLRNKGIKKGSKGLRNRGLKANEKNASNPKILKSSIPRVALLTSSMNKKEKDAIIKKVKNGAVDLVIGTHALISDQIAFKNLSFAVIDEQHKFGVRQRALLTEKGNNPDVLIMTATPIPRTLCITLYGDLDVSVIDELPPGRGKIKTSRYGHEEAGQVYRLVREKIKEGRQAYIVYPIIEESEKLDLKAAEDMCKHFKAHEFKDLHIALVHGQMKQNEAQKIMQDFKAGKIDVLVATTVLEVGVDVPNASMMVIEHAERFGLSQLHQLRGRIGRGTHDSLCILISDPTTDDGQKRLDALLSTNDGFVIAQKDLEIRGPGRYFGRHQHGLNELKVANPATQIEILELARKEAERLLAEDPHLNKGDHYKIKFLVTQRYPTYLKDVGAG